MNTRTIITDTSAQRSQSRDILNLLISERNESDGQDIPTDVQQTGKNPDLHTYPVLAFLFYTNSHIYAFFRLWTLGTMGDQRMA